MPKPKTKAEARAQGLLRYWPNKLCLEGHIGLRDVRTDECVTCVIRKRQKNRHRLTFSADFFRRFGKLGANGIVRPECKDILVDFLPLGVRARNSLLDLSEQRNYEGESQSIFMTLEELSQYTEAELLRSPNLGRLTFNEISTFLRENDIDLAIDPPVLYRSSEALNPKEWRAKFKDDNQPIIVTYKLTNTSNYRWYYRLPGAPTPWREVGERAIEIEGEEKSAPPKKEKLRHDPKPPTRTSQLVPGWYVLQHVRSRKWPHVKVKIVSESSQSYPWKFINHAEFALYWNGDAWQRRNAKEERQ